jgi:hypothetical protein
LRAEVDQPVGDGRRDELHSGPDMSRGPAWLLLYSGVDTLVASCARRIAGPLEAKASTCGSRTIPLLVPSARTRG